MYTLQSFRRLPLAFRVRTYDSTSQGLHSSRSPQHSGTHHPIPSETAVVRTESPANPASSCSAACERFPRRLSAYQPKTKSANGDKVDALPVSARYCTDIAKKPWFALRCWLDQYASLVISEIELPR